MLVCDWNILLASSGQLSCPCCPLVSASFPKSWSNAIFHLFFWRKASSAKELFAVLSLLSSQVTPWHGSPGFFSLLNPFPSLSQFSLSWPVTETFSIGKSLLQWISYTKLPQTAPESAAQAPNSQLCPLPLSDAVQVTPPSCSPEIQIFNLLESKVFLVFFCFVFTTDPSYFLIYFGCTLHSKFTGREWGSETGLAAWWAPVLSL